MGTYAPANAISAGIIEDEGTKHKHVWLEIRDLGGLRTFQQDRMRSGKSPVVFMTRDLSLKSVAQAIFRMSELHIEVARN